MRGARDMGGGRDAVRSQPESRYCNEQRAVGVTIPIFENLGGWMVLDRVNALVAILAQALLAA